YPKQQHESWPHPDFNPSLFIIDGKHTATFSKEILTKLLDELATQTKDYICKTHSMPTVTKRRNYYFYELLTAYQQAATQNHLIDTINKQKAIENLTIKPI
ncbi:8835_t:CDS:1, partial [Racocetra fulgida]